MNFLAYTTLAEYRLIAAFKNLFKIKDKRPYAEAVWDMLQKSYARIGGIKGRGFNSIDDMLEHIPMWKLYFKNGVLTALILYKDRQGRKLIAVATNGTSEGKAALESMFKYEFSRAYSELSGPMLYFVQRVVRNLHAYRIPFSTVKVLLQKHWKSGKLRELPGEMYKYQRQLGGHWYTKEMFGTPGKPITSDNY